MCIFLEIKTNDILIPSMYQSTCTMSCHYKFYVHCAMSRAVPCFFVWKPKLLSLRQNQPKASTHLEDVYINIIIPPSTCTILYLL